MKKLMIRAFTVLFFLQVIIPSVSAEQLGLRAPDIESPVIIFDKSNSSLEDGIQTFSVIATDNIGVANVTLYYKGANDLTFTPKIMKQSSSDPTLYSTEISVDSVITSKLEVYIRADDISGNSVFEGQKFSPFVFTIEPREFTKNDVTSVSQAPASKEEGMSTWALILIGVGVLALAGGGGGGSSSSDEGTITITTQLPGN